MALVMLPCDLPWWPQVQRFLRQLDVEDVSVDTLSRVLTNIHVLCK